MGSTKKKNEPRKRRRKPPPRTTICKSDIHEDEAKIRQVNTHAQAYLALEHTPGNVLYTYGVRVLCLLCLYIHRRCNYFSTHHTQKRRRKNTSILIYVCIA